MASETTITLSLKRSHTIAYIKTRTQATLDVPILAQRLKFQNVLLDDNDTVGHFNILDLYLNEEAVSS